MTISIASLNKLPPKQALLCLLQEKAKRRSENALARYRPYARQKEFHHVQVRERLFMAGNQLGKTWSGGFEMAMHLTGKYPAWWEGRRFDKPICAWASGVTGESVRDTTQRIMLGRPGCHGTGAIPARDLVDVTSARGVPNAVDTVRVRHISGGISTLGFKSYEKGREKWQGETLHVVWYDEEPPQDIYTEGLTRTNATRGMVYMTFTPLLGMSEVVRRFLDEHSPDRNVTSMTIDDAEHYTDEERQRIIAGYPAHEREARAKGIPVLGSGRIFPIEEERIREPAIAIPAHWPRICGMDFGWDHPTAAAWLAWDRDSDTVHIYDAYRVREDTPVVHASAIRARGSWIPVSWPHDGLQHDKGSGEQLAQQYRNHGANMLPLRATWPDGTNGVEAGLFDMFDRMKTGRLRVADHLNDWWHEFRLYHRKDGKVVKEADDLMSATRYGIMMLRHAATEPDEDDYEDDSWGRGRSPTGGY
jgi:phage terminase large subunit-like protein